MKNDLFLRIGIFGVIISWLISSFPSFWPIPQLTANFVSFILNIFQINSINYNNFLIIPFSNVDRIFELSAECSGIVLLSVFLFCIFISPKFKFSHRIFALLFIPFLFLGNVTRILTSIFLAKNYGVGFSIFFHNTFGQVLIFGITILCYIGWLKSCRIFPTEKDLQKGDEK